jgi:hypothetical protein
VRELVRLHHLTNCLLCHPPASTDLDPVLGADPIVSLASANATLARAGQVLQKTPGAHSYGSASRNGPALLRADITYLRQDFSVLQDLPPALASLRTQSGPLADPMQRFDFVVRKRPVSTKEAEQLRTAAGERASFPQRESVLFALREITGRDAGTSYAAWLKLYPDAGEEAEAARLGASLADAKAQRRAQLLARYRDEKGVAFTLALAEAIPNLEGKFQDQARDALVERLKRMTIGTLQERLREEDPELRRAAAVACGRKRDETVIPDLIALLDDKDRDVAEAAGSGLRELTGESATTPQEWRELVAKHGIRNAAR